MAQAEVETAIIGAGQAGVPLARPGRGGPAGGALAERNHPGGSCVNWGCTPSEAMIASSRLAAQARSASEWGVRIPRVEVDFAAVVGRARGMVEAARASTAARANASACASGPTRCSRDRWCSTPARAAPGRRSKGWTTCPRSA